MKIIKIDRCNMCPYFETELPGIFIEGGQYCEYTGRRPQRICAFNDVTPVKIPKWCPLEEETK